MKEPKSAMRSETSRICIVFTTRLMLARQPTNSVQIAFRCRMNLGMSLAPCDLNDFSARSVCLGRVLIISMR